MTSLELHKRRQDSEKYYAAENSQKEAILFRSILRFSEEDDHEDRLEGLQDLSQDSTRLKRLDLIITKQAHGQIGYFLEPGHVPFNLAASYEQQLRHYQKRYFDCFRRRTKVELENGFETSYCQLNFFRWMHQFSVLKHLNLKQPVQMPSKKASRAFRDQLVLFRGPLILPGIGKPPETPFKLLLTPQKEYALLNRSIYYYRIQPLQGLAPRREGWTKLLLLKQAL